jgi:hypothetical protein
MLMGDESLLAHFQQNMTVQERHSFFHWGYLTQPQFRNMIGYKRLPAVVTPKRVAAKGCMISHQPMPSSNQMSWGRAWLLPTCLDGTVAGYQHDIDVHYGLLRIIPANPPKIRYTIRVPWLFYM